MMRNTISINNQAHHCVFYFQLSGINTLQLKLGSSFIPVLHWTGLYENEYTQCK